MEFKKKLLLINVQELLFYAGMVSLSFIAVILGAVSYTHLYMEWNKEMDQLKNGILPARRSSSERNQD